MDAPDPRGSKTPQKLIRDAIELCADCDTCRTLMEEECVFFPELYRLWDRENDDGIPITDEELQKLAGLCTLCGMCPCPRITADLIEAKSFYCDRKGLPLATRLLSDVPRLARLGSIFPNLTRVLQSNNITALMLKKVTHTHAKRQLPSFPKQNFFEWARQKGLNERRVGGRKVVYFAGCSAGYLFPQVGRAVVEVLERNGVAVHVPPQECCGMPHLVEGDRTTTLQQTKFNMETLLDLVQAGNDLICSCPTCGYYMRVLLKDRVFYSEEYQRSVNAGKDEIRIPDYTRGSKKLKVLHKSMFKHILKDDGYFCSLNPMSRIDLAEHLSDVGEYLARLHAEGQLDIRFSTIPEQMVYFAPCHQREQKIGSPYLELLSLVPGISIEQVGENDCCGMGGNFGFKVDFYEKSLAIGRPLMEKILKKAPKAIITDCMSCALQFRHTLPYPVFHPIEILARAYQA